MQQPQQRPTDQPDQLDNVRKPMNQTGGTTDPQRIPSEQPDSMNEGLSRDARPVTAIPWVFLIISVLAVAAMIWFLVTKIS